MSSKRKAKKISSKINFLSPVLIMHYLPLSVVLYYSAMISFCSPESVIVNEIKEMFKNNELR